MDCGERTGGGKFFSNCDEFTLARWAFDSKPPAVGRRFQAGTAMGTGADKGNFGAHDRCWMKCRRASICVMGKAAQGRMDGQEDIFMFSGGGSKPNQPPRFLRVAGVFRSRAKTTATTFSRPRGDDLNMRRRHPDPSAWWRR